MATILIETAASAGATVAHARLVRRIMQMYTEFDYAFGDGDLRKYWNKRFDKICIVYNTYYANYRRIAAFIERNPDAELYFMINEYDFSINTRIMKLFTERGWSIIANFVRGAERQRLDGLKQFHQINLNAAGFRVYKQRFPKKYDVVYYGTFREDRLSYFQKYLHNTGVVVSASDKSAKRFTAAGINGRFIKPLQWEPKPQLSAFWASLYIEDKHTHKYYNYPANRFYEAIGAGAFPVFDVSVRGTFEKYGLEIPDIFWVDGVDQLFAAVDEIKHNSAKYTEILKHWERLAADESHRELQKIHRILS